MKTPRYILIALALFSLPERLLAEAGIWQSYGIFSSVNNSNSSLLNQYYDMQANFFPDFNNNNFGTFNLSDSSNLLQLKGGELSLFKNNFWDVSAATMYYRVWDNAIGSGSTTFSSVAFGYMSGDGNPNQKWGTSGLNINLLNGLAAQKTYSIEVYFDINTNQSGDAAKRYDSNSGANYIATFSTIPEPSSAGLMALGAAGLLALRRRLKT
jgi:hypothetical protein